MNTNTTNTTETIRCGNLTRCSFRKFNPSLKNRKAVDEYSATYGVDKKMLTSTVRLIPKRFTDPLQTIESECRALVEKYTSPWEDRGNRLLSFKMTAKFQEKIRVIRYKWDKAVDNFVSEWADIVRGAEADLGSDFQRFSRFYPSGEHVRSRFQMTLTFMPMPDNDRLAAELREEMEEVFDIRMEEAGLDLRMRLISKLEHLSSKCKSAGEEGTRFYSSNIENVLEICDFIPDMLIGDDQALLRAVRDTEDALRGINSDDIKSSPDIAEDVQRKAADIISSLTL